MSSELPWTDIRSPSAGYHRRIASAASVVPVSWAKNPQSQYLLIIELDGDYADRFNGLDLSVRGMTVDLRLSERTQIIVITLEEQVNADLFHSFCRSLILALEAAEDPAAAFSITASQISRWRTFLSGRKSRKLDDDEIRGLFAELWVLRQVLAFTRNSVETVTAWCGPDKTHQDFIFRDLAVETKSLSGRERNSVRISSENQLESLGDRLYLTIVRLVAVSEKSQQAQSLNALVRIVEHELADADALDHFGRKISAVGYFDLPDYDEPEFIVADQTFYNVGKGFPRLVRSELPDGVAHVSYQIELEAIESCRCSEREVWS